MKQGLTADAVEAVARSERVRGREYSTTATCGSGETKTKGMACSGLPGPSPLARRRRRRRGARWTRRLGPGSSLATRGHGRAPAMRSVVVGFVAGVRGRGSGGEEWRRGAWVRLQGCVEGPGRGRWRLGGRRRTRLSRWHSTEQLGGTGEEEDNGEGCWAGPRPGKWAFARGDR